jgi:HlyD family secretion protein
MTASVEIFTEKVQNVWSVPIQAVVMREDTGKLKTGEMREAVFTVDKGKAHLIFVKTGLQDLYHIQIVEGINDSLEIITGPYDVLVKQLREGSVVKIKNERSEK